MSDTKAQMRPLKEVDRLREANARLEQERDEARRMWCERDDYDEGPAAVAKRLGWAYLYPEGDEG